MPIAVVSCYSSYTMPFNKMGNCANELFVQNIVTVTSVITDNFLSLSVKVDYKPLQLFKSLHMFKILTPLLYMNYLLANFNYCNCYREMSLRMLQLL